MPLKVLISGGAVHAYLDAVKIITNRFKGGLMAQLAYDFWDRNPRRSSDEINVTYLCAKNSKLPDNLWNQINIIYHDGFWDYEKKVLELAPQMDVVILGAAVANLIPLEPWEGKFPSHNYKVGDRIDIPFTIAPRIIAKVKAVSPNTHLFGFKLLSGVSREELVSAAYDIILESKATTVFANDAKNLNQVIAVTKERGQHEMNRTDIVDWVLQCSRDIYYKTEAGHNENSSALANAERKLTAFRIDKLKERFADKFPKVQGNYVFGAIAVRVTDESEVHGGFVTMSRGKHEIDAPLVYVYKVDHEKHIVYTQGESKATLNAPLLDWIFNHMWKVQSIVHYHEQVEGLETLPYAPPGTVRDSQRIGISKSFNIAGHGCFLLLNESGEIL